MTKHIVRRCILASILFLLTAVAGNTVAHEVVASELSKPRSCGEMATAEPETLKVGAKLGWLLTKTTRSSGSRRRNSRANSPGIRSIAGAAGERCKVMVKAPDGDR